MKKSSIIIFVIAVIVFVCSLAFYIYTCTYNKPTNNVAKEELPVEEVSETQDIENVNFIDFTFYKKDGTEVKLSSVADKPIMMMFWNPNDEKSVEDFNKINDFYKNYKDKVSFVILATCPTDEMPEEYEKDIEFEMYYDLYKEGAKNYKVENVPSIVYIDKDQNVFNAKTGFSTSDAIEANLDILTENI